MTYWSTRRLLRRCRRSITPIVWAADALDSSRPVEELKRIRKLLDSYNLTAGVILPVHNAKGERAAVMLMGPRGKLTLEELSELNLLVIHAYDVYDKLANRK